MVGDREHYILGARSVGIIGIGVLCGYGFHGELGAAGAKWVVDRPAELEAAIECALNEI